jgi:hypothetical protein
VSHWVTRRRPVVKTKKIGMGSYDNNIAIVVPRRVSSKNVREHGPWILRAAACALHKPDAKANSWLPGNQNSPGPPASGEGRKEWVRLKLVAPRCSGL